MYSIKNRFQYVNIALAFLLLNTAFVLSGCYAGKGTSLFGSSTVAVGPKSSSKIMAESEPSSSSSSSPAVRSIQKEMEIIIPVFEPNIPNDSDTLEEEGIWPELRRVESIKFALEMKKALESTNQLGAVRVTPDQKVTGDIYVIGKINESTGEDISINVQVVGIDGKSWLNKNYKHEVDERFFTSVRNKNKNSYHPVFEQAADDIVKKLRNKDHNYLSELNQLSEVRFAYSMSDESFEQFLNFRGSRVKLVQVPSDNDPMFKRIYQYRIEDQLFTDKMQQYYYDFSQKVKSSYETWQEAALEAAKARSEARSRAGWQALTGILAIGLGAVAAANNNNYSVSGNTAAIGAITAGAVLLSDSAQSYEESKMHQETLNELGKSIDVEVAPQVIEFEEKTIKLNGDAAAQFNQWRAALKRIYAEEQTPDKQL